MEPPYVRPLRPPTHNGPLYGPGFIGLMTPGDTLPPPSRPVEPPFPVGDVRKVVHRLRGGFYNAFHGPPPDGGASRRRDGVVVVLVVTDPLRGAGRTHPLRGRAVTVTGYMSSY